MIVFYPMSLFGVDRKGKEQQEYLQTVERNTDMDPGPSGGSSGQIRSAMLFP
jgi:hypothetical protein